MATVSRLKELWGKSRRFLVWLVAKLEREISQLQAERCALLAERKWLRGKLQKARRAGKRQAAPFSKGEPKKNPKRPGRKSGADYGRHGRRLRPDHVDVTLEAPLPPRCQNCGSEHFEGEEIQQVFEEEIPPVRPKVTCYNLHTARCCDCGKLVQGRHSEQVSGATHAAACHLGPNALATAAQLNKELALPYGRIARIFQAFFSISVTRGGLCQAIQRVADRCLPTYRALVTECVRPAPVVAVDETGWKVGGILEWLWVFATEIHTVYAILPGRGYEEAAGVLGEDFAGVLERDGWAPYRRFVEADHQTCLSHLIRRCDGILEVAQRGEARFPHAVLDVLHKALVLRDRRDEGLLSSHGLAVATGRIQCAMDRLLAWNPVVPENRKLRNHLRNERDALFTFLKRRDVEATSWRADHAIRAQIGTRKVSGGNRTWRGAEVHQILGSVLRTSWQQGRSFVNLMVPLLRSPQPRVAVELLGFFPCLDPVPP